MGFRQAKGIYADLDKSTLEDSVELPSLDTQTIPTAEGVTKNKSKSSVNLPNVNSAQPKEIVSKQSTTGEELDTKQETIVEEVKDEVIVGNPTKKKATSVSKDKT